MKPTCYEASRKVICKLFAREYTVYIRYYLDDDDSLYIAQFRGCNVAENCSACSRCRDEVMDRFEAGFMKDSIQ